MSAAIGAAAIGDAGRRELASEWGGPPTATPRGERRAQAARSQAGERVVRVPPTKTGGVSCC